MLENGRASIYAPYFDIDWDPINTKLPAGSSCRSWATSSARCWRTKSSGELCARRGRFYLCYYDKSFPLNPRSYAEILEPNKEQLISQLGADSEAASEYQSILTAINNLPPRNETDPAKTVERNREKEVIKRRLANLCAAEPRVGKFIEGTSSGINGTPGDPHSFDALDNLLGQAGLPAELLAGGGRGDQLPPLLRRQRAGRHPDRPARGFRRDPPPGIRASSPRASSTGCASTTWMACWTPRATSRICKGLTSWPSAADT